MIDEKTETGARNLRKICVLQLNTQDNFEVIHGALCLLMTKIGAELGKDFSLEECDDKMFFPGRGASVILSGAKIGQIGVLHPEVMENFQLKNPVSMFEVDMEPVWQFFKSH